MNPTKSHIPFLDHLRGVAILAVFICHGSLPCLAFTRQLWLAPTRMESGIST